MSTMRHGPAGPAIDKAAAYLGLDRDLSALLGVLDLDSPTRGRFDSTDQVGLERLAATFVRSLG